MMSDNVKRFLELLEMNPAMKRKAEDLSKNADDGTAALIALAAAHNIILTEEDFRPAGFDELSEDELAAVAGGEAATECFCALCGTGGQCCCSAAGQGMSSGLFCTCAVGGYGSF